MNPIEKSVYDRLCGIAELLETMSTVAFQKDMGNSDALSFLADAVNGCAEDLERARHEDNHAD